jgi:Fe-S cluster assembly protein SufD
MDTKTAYLVFSEKLKHKEYVVLKGETLKIVFFATSAVHCAFDLDIRLTGKDSTAEVTGLVIPKPHTDIVLHTHQIHEHPHTKSTLLVKSVIPDRSMVTYEGTIRIEKGAFRSDAYQKNETMLLGDTAQIHTSPILEILNHDVKCTHGATSKPIPEEELLYLQSRGISRSQAHRMIVKGFIDDIVSQFPDLKMKKSMYNDIHLVHLI